MALIASSISAWFEYGKMTREKRFHLVDGSCCSICVRQPRVNTERARSCDTGLSIFNASRRATRSATMALKAQRSPSNDRRISPALQQDLGRRLPSWILGARGWALQPANSVERGNPSLHNAAECDTIPKFTLFCGTLIGELRNRTTRATSFETSVALVQKPILDSTARMMRSSEPPHQEKL